MAIRRNPGYTKREWASAILVGVMTVAAYLAVGAGVFYAFLSANGVLNTQVPVRLTAEAPAHEDATLPCVEGWPLDGDGCEPAATPDQWRGGVSLPVRHSDGLFAEVYDLDPTTAFLGAAPAWGGLIVGGLVGLVLIPALRATASGRPFARGNARRLMAATALVVLGWVLITVGPALAAPAVIEALEALRYGGPDGPHLLTGWIAPDLRITWWPLLIAGLFGTLAAATRQGARLAADTEGLV